MNIPRFVSAFSIRCYRFKTFELANFSINQPTSMSDATQDTTSAVAKTQKDPSSFLNEITGNEVIVKLSSGLEYHGK